MTDKILSYLFLFILATLFCSCEKAEGKIDESENSIIGKWKYARIAGVAYQNDSLTSEFAIIINPNSFIEFRADNTYTSELLLLSLQDIKTGIWRLDEQTNTIILDEGIEDIDNWKIISSDKNTLQILSIGIEEPTSPNDTITLKLETIYTFTR